MTKNKEYLTWTYYLLLIEELYEKINWKDEKFKSIIAINRGGNVIGTVLSHKTEIPLTILNKGGIIYEREKFIVVDDIADTGSTLANIDYLAQGQPIKYHPLQASNKDYKIATLHYKKDSKVVPNYFVKETDKWIVYPYEQD